MSHWMPGGEEKPLLFMSRTLNKAERKHSQIEKEALACVVGVTRSLPFCMARFHSADRPPSLFHEKNATLGQDPRMAKVYCYIEEERVEDELKSCWSRHLH